jgi:hypothetical protein
VIKFVSDLWKILDKHHFGASGRWFSQGTPNSSANKTDSHDIAEILLKVALNTIALTPCP